MARKVTVFFVLVAVVFLGMAPVMSLNRAVSVSEAGAWTASASAPTNGLLLMGPVFEGGPGGDGEGGTDGGGDSGGDGGSGDGGSGDGGGDGVIIVR